MSVPHLRPNRRHSIQYSAFISSPWAALMNSHSRAHRLSQLFGALWCSFCDSNNFTGTPSCRSRWLPLRQLLVAARARSAARAAARLLSTRNTSKLSPQGAHVASTVVTVIATVINHTKCLCHVLTTGLGPHLSVVNTTPFLGSPSRQCSVPSEVS